jgi:hypothetical protein
MGSGIAVELAQQVGGAVRHQGLLAKLRGRELCPSLRCQTPSNGDLSSGARRNNEHNTIFLPNFKGGAYLVNHGGSSKPMPQRNRVDKLTKSHAGKYHFIEPNPRVM